MGIRIVRPTQRGLIERLGKYHNFANPGFHWIIPIIDKIYMVNVTEQMVDAPPQEIITNDNLNASVDAQVYFKVKSDEERGKGSIYMEIFTMEIVTLPVPTSYFIGTITA
jgi:regulator of protease activity HflC (stomatin/prohibitin superfamily)